jgi:D-sedoheptulose 7-phosphate isomerase
MNPILDRAWAEHMEIAQRTAALKPQIQALAEAIIQTLQAGGKILLCGNGGSAADAQHIAAEFTGRYVRERRGLPAIALTTDTSALTAIGNDYGYERVFARQVEALGRTGDLLIGISTSGNSGNVLAAFSSAREIGIECWGFAGRDGGKMSAEIGDRNLVVPSQTTARIQEMHILIGHLVCELADEAFVES